MAMPGGATVLPAPAQPTYMVPWDRLRAWVDEKQSWEAQHRRPAPLTDQELAAVSQLVPFSDDEPVVEDKDFVSVLMRYVQARKLSSPVWSEDSVRTIVDGHLQTKWRCFCAFEGVSGTFPRQGYGVAAGGEAPAFQSKKKAKQFAAQQVLAFLMGDSKPAATGSSTGGDSATGSGSGGGSGAAALDDFTTPSKRLRLSSHTTDPSSEAPDQLSRTPSAGGASLTPVHTDIAPAAPAAPAPAPVPATTTRDRHRDRHRDPTVFDCVRRLAEALGLESPTYNIGPDPELPNLWTGGAIFKPGSRIPEGLGTVRQVLGKQDARVQAAQEVLAWLQGEKSRREADMAYLRGLASQG